MATVLVLTHPNDPSPIAPLPRARRSSPIGPTWGTRVIVHEGTAKSPRADLALLHVDRTVVPDEYIEALGRYPVVINGATRDIGKRVISANLVGPYDDYRGPAIVKTNANASGIPRAAPRGALAL